MPLYTKTALCLLALSIIGSSAHAASEKRYEIPRAMVAYKISGGGALSDDVNLTIEGKGKLRFKEWGAVSLVERHILEETSGALHYRARRDVCEKQMRKEVLDVDYENKKILQRPLPKGTRHEDLTAGLKRIGQQMIADVVCDMWEGEGVRRCLYKGVPLFSEYRALGLLYREEATKIVFDINVSDISQCSVPSYPVEKFALFTKNFKTRSKKVPKAFAARFRMVMEILHKKGYDPDALPPRSRKELIDIIGEPIYTAQKKLLPELLQTMKRSRACLMQAEDTPKANACIKDLIKLKSSFTDDKENRIDDWQHEREKLLERLDAHIVDLEMRMKCIRGAKNFGDLATCMKGDS